MGILLQHAVQRFHIPRAARRLPPGDKTFRERMRMLLLKPVFCSRLTELLPLPGCPLQQSKLPPADFGHEAPTFLLIPLCLAKDLHGLSHLEKLSRRPRCHWVWANWLRHPARPRYPTESEKESRPTLKNLQELHRWVNHNPLQSLDLVVLQKVARRHSLKFILPKHSTIVHPPLRKDKKKPQTKPHKGLPTKQSFSALRLHSLSRSHRTIHVNALGPCFPTNLMAEDRERPVSTHCLAACCNYSPPSVPRLPTVQ